MNVDFEIDINIVFVLNIIDLYFKELVEKRIWKKVN